MKEANRKIIDAKRRILSFIKGRENSHALKVFHKYFSQENPPDPEFMINVYTELNKLDQIELGFRLLEEVAPWMPDEPEVQSLRANALKIYFDQLLARGNQLLVERDEKSNLFFDSLKRVDSMSRDKVKEENDKILLGMTQKALENFRKAYEINPDSLGAITGLYKCYKILGDETNINRFQTILEEKNPILYGKKEQEEEEKASFAAQEFDIEEFNIKEVQSLYDRNKYEELIQRVDFLHLTHKISVPLLILKAESLVSLKRFKEADKVIFEAEKQSSHLKEVRELKNQIYEIKYDLLSKAGAVYLKKALELGPSLGESHFKKAKACLKRSLEIFPDNIDLLDQLYTVLCYLKEDEEAFKTKAMIYLLNDRFIPTFDREGTNTLCFIATYAYEGKIEQIETFRWFRREFLLNSKPGRILNCFYVKHSSAFTRFARQKKVPSICFRVFLFPILMLIKFLRACLKFR
jgi:tetratricopeptide (TPR) repeat protein